MRNPNRIKPFLEQVEKMWLQNPDLRFGQLVSILDSSIDMDIFYIEEDDLIKVVNTFIK